MKIKIYEYRIHKFSELTFHRVNFDKFAKSVYFLSISIYRTNDMIFKIISLFRNTREIIYVVSEYIRMIHAGINLLKNPVWWGREKKLNYYTFNDLNEPGITGCDYRDAERWNCRANFARFIQSVLRRGNRANHSELWIFISHEDNPCYLVVVSQECPALIRPALRVRYCTYMVLLPAPE